MNYVGGGVSVNYSLMLHKVHTRDKFPCMDNKQFYSLSLSLSLYIYVIVSPFFTYSVV